MIYHEDEWEHGMICETCEQPFREGDEIYTSILSVLGGGTPIVGDHKCPRCWEACAGDGLPASGEVGGRSDAPTTQAASPTVTGDELPGGVFQRHHMDDGSADTYMSALRPRSASEAKPVAVTDRWVLLGDLRAERKAARISCVSIVKATLDPSLPVCVHGWVIDESCPACARQNGVVSLGDDFPKVVA